MIMIAIRNIRDVNKEKFDQVWLIVRSAKTVPDGMRHVSELSPSWDLFAKYRQLKKDGHWDAQTFQAIYVPQFLREMHALDARRRLNELWVLDRQGKRIALCCYCPDERLCHRSIVVGLLSGVGCGITTLTGRNYKGYYEQYCECTA